MRSEEEVLAALRALKESDGDRQAPPEVEERVRRAFHRKRRGRNWQWALAAAAAMVVILGAAYFRVQRPQPVRIGSQPPEVSAPAAVVQAAAPLVVEQPVRKAARVRRATPREVATQFFPLVDTAMPVERGELVRVKLPAAAMRSVGLPVREDRLQERVQADVLVSEEGMATAIRFVNYVK